MQKKVEIARFNIEDANQIFEKLVKFYDSKVVESWKDKVDKDVNFLFKKYKVEYFNLNKNSYMGIVLDCHSYTYNNIFIKIVPPMINRYFYETETLKKLPSFLTCDFIGFDKEKSAIVMKKVEPGDLIPFNGNEKIIKNLFENLYSNKISITKEINSSFLGFDEVVYNDYQICKKYNLNDETINNLFKQFNYYYDEIKNCNQSYLLHGDVYKNNIVRSKSGPIIIDPLGFKAPFVMELTSICAYEMFYSTGNNKEIFDFFCKFFEEFVNREIYKKAVFCQLVKVLIPSTFEANDGGIRVGKWLNIIKDLYKEMI